MQVIRTFKQRWAKNYVNTACDTCNVTFQDGDKIIYTLNGRQGKNVGGRIRHARCFTDAQGNPIYDNI